MHKEKCCYVIYSKEKILIFMYSQKKKHASIVTMVRLKAGTHDLQSLLASVNVYDLLVGNRKDGYHTTLYIDVDM